MSITGRDVDAVRPAGGRAPYAAAARRVGAGSSAAVGETSHNGACGEIDGGDASFLDGTVAVVSNADINLIVENQRR